MNADTTKYYYLKDHLGSTRAVINSQNQVVSAQDYDVWGYLHESRSYQSNNTKYKYTGKERDNENNYDYFGARYYDSRIGRWGGVEPLLEKYFNYSTYLYSLNNPLRFTDRGGRDVYIRGDDWEDAFDELSDEFKNSNIKLGYDKISNNSIKLKIISGEAKTDIEKMLSEAITDENVVSLYTQENNYFMENGEKVWFAIGSFGGGKKTGDIFQGTQFINMKSARDFSNMPEGPSVGSSVLHEILEAITAVKDFPGESFSPALFRYSHDKATLMQKERVDYYETFIFDKDGISPRKVYEHNIKYNKDYLLYENE